MLFGFSKLFDDKSTEEETSVFSYNKLLDIYKKEYRRTPGIGGCIISIGKESEEKGLVSLRDYWRVKLVFCDVKEQPLKKPGEDAFYGVIIRCDSLDKKISALMNGEKRIVFKPDEAEMKQINKKSIFDTLIDSLSDVIVDAITDVADIQYIKTFRERSGTKVVIAHMDVLLKKASAEYKEEFINSLKDMNNHEKYVIAEYDSVTDELVKIKIVKGDEKVKKFVENNNGIVILED